MLAQATSGEIGTWVLVAILVINGVGAVGGLVAIFATRREVEAIERRVSAAEDLRDEDRKEGSERRARIYAELKTQREDLNKVAGELHDKINKVDREVGGLKSATEIQTAQLARIETSVHRLAERS